MWVNQRKAYAAVWDTRPRDDRRTGYVLGVTSALSSSNEYYIMLAGIDIIIFQDEELVDSILLERIDFNNRSNGTD